MITRGEVIGFISMYVPCSEDQANAKAQEAMTGDLRNTFIVELIYRVKKQEEQASENLSLEPNETLLCD